MTAVAPLPQLEHDREVVLERYSCDACRYGVSRLLPPERCPMCGGSAWSPEGRGRTSDGA